MRDQAQKMQIHSSRRWVGVHIATIGALLSIVLGLTAMLFGDNPDGIVFTALFWLGAVSALMVFVGIVVQLVVTYTPERNPNRKE